MNRYPWIRNSGSWRETELRQTLAAYPDFDYALALYADHMRCVSWARREDLLDDVGQLLELRAFNGAAELWLHRTMLGKPFLWRLADENGIARAVEGQGVFFSDPARYHIEVHQALDIDGRHVPDPAPARLGGRLVRSTGGGVYELPEDVDVDGVTLVQYIAYDEATGVGSVADFRIKGFEALREVTIDG